MAAILEGSHTQGHNEKLWELVMKDFEQDYESEEVLEKLNDPDFFRPFSERLLAFYNEATNCSFTVDEARADLQRRAKDANIDLKRGAINNWFSGSTEPKYGDDDRRRMFAVAFALELDVEQTMCFFHKVFLDRAFNLRSDREFVYLHCIFNKKSFSVADALIQRLGASKDSVVNTEHTEHTQLLVTVAGQDIDENELLEFIAAHPYNFSLRNTAAKKHRSRLLEALTSGSKGRDGLAKQEYERRRSELADSKDAYGFDGKDVKSVDFLLFMIMGVDFAKKGTAEIRSIRDKFHRKEVYNQFPDKQTISMENPSSYILRKDIILLYFYEYWVNDYLSGQNRGDYDGFVDGLNDVLFDCGFSPLYIGNPYDWLFLFCSACAADDYTPLDRFRGILGQV